MSIIAYCKFSVSDDFVSLWNSNNTDTTLQSGNYYTATIIGSAEDSKNVQLLISTPDDRKNYVVSKKDGVWGPIYQIATIDDVPTKVSQLENDRGYTTYTPSFQQMTVFC